MFQIVRLELDRDDRVVARRPLQPPYELLEDAMALAEFDASRCAGAYGYDGELECWWAQDNGRGTESAQPGDAPSTFTALEEQPGLRLESRKAPVEILVIDRWEAIGELMTPGPDARYDTFLDGLRSLFGSFER